MHRYLSTIDCSKYFSKTQRPQGFRVVKYVFDYPNNFDDKRLLDEYEAQGKRLAKVVNPKAANDSIRKRHFDRVVNNCIAGAVSEGLWKDFLNHKKPLVRATTMEQASTQVDLEVLVNGKKIEVRSSFPRNGIPFALCHPSQCFDVLGGYANAYKLGEMPKDIYVRTLFHLAIERYWQKEAQIQIPIVEKLHEKMKKSGFEVYLTGGATWAMMQDKTIACTKNLIPEDERQLDQIKTKSAYQVVPFHKALDTVEIYHLINDYRQ